MKLPLSVGEAPSTPWNSSGINTIAPNIANPVKKMMTSEIATIRFLKMPKGMIGSLTRSSVKTNARPATTLIVNAPMT